jgi:putative NIF3 family GTP cyclohydrolase 1 type 2
VTAAELNAYLTGLVSDLPAQSVDRIIHGDPERLVRGIAVAWMPYASTLHQAASLGANVLVVHEPTFYDHWDRQERMAASPEADEKRRLIDSLGLTIIRCHDVWDAMPEVGIPYAWGSFLGFGEPLHGVRHYNVYAVPEQTARTLAADVAARTAGLGQGCIGLYGDPDRVVGKVGVGTGCISDPWRMYDLGADLAISVDDVVRAWIAGEWCRDTGRPLLMVNHAVSEEPGMVSLARYLATALPGMPVTHVAQGCSYMAVA